MHYIVNINVLNKLNLLKNSIYTSWIKNEFVSVGKGVCIHKAITLIGGKRISIGYGTSICKGTILTCWENRQKQKFNSYISIGDKSCIGEYNHITCINKIKIGNGVLTGRWVTITDNSHGSFIMNDLKQRPQHRDMVSKGPVIIEDNVWIGDKVTILPNVTIGKGSIIASNAVVTRDVPPYSVMAGVPAKIIKIINKNYV